MDKRKTKKKAKKKAKRWHCREESRTVHTTREKGKPVVYVVIRGRCIKR